MTTLSSNDILGVGSSALHALRRSLNRDLGEQAAVCLQEAGYAAGAQIYGAFCSWLPGYAGVSDPADLDARVLGEVLSAFFDELGWGSLTIERAGRSALAVTSMDWAEADPAEDAAIPSCHVAAGLLADFMGRLSETPVAVMEVACRSRKDSECRFLVGTPEAMDAVYEALAAGHDYASVLSG
jgi:predicted hydrocarbon binding protein